MTITPADIQASKGVKAIIKPRDDYANQISEGGTIFLTYVRVVHQTMVSFKWRYDNRDGVSNHRRPDCLLNCFSGADQRKYQSSASLAFVRGSTCDRRIPLTKGQ